MSDVCIEGGSVDDFGNEFNLVIDYTRQQVWVAKNSKYENIVLGPSEYCSSAELDELEDRGLAMTNKLAKASSALIRQEIANVAQKLTDLHTAAEDKSVFLKAVSEWLARMEEQK